MNVEKKQLSIEDSARLLLSTAMAGEPVFFDQILPEISEYSEINLTDYDVNVLRGEVMIICLWAAKKALEGEQQILTQEMQDGFFDFFLDERHDVFKKIFAYKSERYDEAWDEDSVDNQAVLAVEMLTQLFYAEEPDQGLLHLESISLIQAFVFNTMKNVLDTRSEIDIIPERGDYERRTPERLAFFFVDAVMENMQSAAKKPTFNDCDDIGRLIGELACLLMFAVHFTIHDYFGEEPEGIELHEAILNQRIRLAKHATDANKAQNIIDAQDQRISHYVEVARTAVPEKWLQAVGDEFAKLSGNERDVSIAEGGIAELRGMMNYVRDMLHNASC